MSGHCGTLQDKDSACYTNLTLSSEDFALAIPLCQMT